MSEEPFLNYGRQQFRHRGRISVPGDPGRDVADRTPVFRNHRRVDESFDIARWKSARERPPEDGRPISVIDGGSRLAVKASSMAFPPTSQFRFWVKAIPLNEDGSPQTSASSPGGWAEAVDYSAATGSGVSKTFIYEAASAAPRHRWLVSIPPQQAAHGNTSAPVLEIFVPRDR